MCPYFTRDVKMKDKANSVKVFPLIALSCLNDASASCWQAYTLYRIKELKFLVPQCLAFTDSSR